MPTFLFPMFKPKALGSIKKGVEEVGRVVGINTKPLKDSDGNQCIKFVEAIKKVKKDSDSMLYIEDFDLYSLEFFAFIEERTELKFNTGDNIRTKNIPLILSEITKKLSKDMHQADTLIICNNRDRIIEIIKGLSAFINFFTVIGVEASIKDEVYNYVYECTGISIFQPNNMEKIIKNYSTIINTMDEIYFDIANIRNQAIIIDFSYNKPLRTLANSKKNCIYIEDINFKVKTPYHLNELGDISPHYNEWINEYIEPELHEGLMEEEKIFSQIYTNNDYLYLEDYVLNKTKIKGRI